MGERAREVSVVVSIDTEEDNWDSVREGLTVENARALPSLADRLRRLGVRPTYFATYQVVTQPWAAAVLREITADGRGELAGHLHPWNTPPTTTPEPRHFSMLCHYSAEAQLAKVKHLTGVCAEAFGRRPVSFRAGRFGANADTIAAIATCGYRVDSSVTPYISWRRVEAGPDFIGAPPSRYRLDGHGDLRRPRPQGPIIEVPLSAGFSALPAATWSRLARLFENDAVRWARLPSVLARLGLVRRVILSPESAGLRDMLSLARGLLEAGLSHLHVFLHSSSLCPGLTPFTATRGDVDRMLGRLEEFLVLLVREVEPRFVTVAEAAEAADPAASPRQ